MNQPSRQKAAQERQTAIFGIMFSTLAILGLIGGLQYSGLVEMPFFNRPFSTEPPPEPLKVPCPVEGALPVTPSETTVNVLNGSSRVGLASQSASALGALDYAIGETANASEPVDGVGQIVFGELGVSAAYTILAHLPEAQMVFLSTRQTATVDLILGQDFDHLDTALSLDATAPLTGVEGCVAIETLLANEEES